MSEITRILSRIDHGDQIAVAALFSLVYDELRGMAAGQLKHERSGQTFQATALVNEAYLRLLGDQRFENRRHFFTTAAQAMRRILVDHARRKQRQKRGGEAHREELSALNLAAPEHSDDLIALDEALIQLQETDLKAAQLVQLRYFVGMSIPDAADVLEISPRTADRLWSYARAWLHEKIYGEPMA